MDGASMDGASMDGASMDAGHDAAVDAGFDAGNPCDGVVCGPFQFCNADGRCQFYPTCPIPDAGVGDAGVGDAGSVDGSAIDGGAFDAGSVDGSSIDGGAFDAAVVAEGGSIDGALPDGPRPDAGVAPDAGLGPLDGGSVTVCSSVCRNGFCIPGDVDVDGDEVPASLDCDETNPNVHPGTVEVCNGIDDDCSGVPDDGDPLAECEAIDMTGVCSDGHCGCAPGTYNLDPTTSDCECTATTPADGTDCSTAIDLGDLSDAGQTVTVTANILPLDREVWYKFRGVDTPDTSCDSYHVRALLTDNPSDAYQITMLRGTCGATPGCDAEVDFSWSTDFRMLIGARLAGQCPCVPPGGASVDNVSTCEDDTAEFYVKVARAARDPADTSPPTCDPFTLEITNGVYSTM